MSCVNKIFVFSSFLFMMIITHVANGLTCGQTVCLDGEACCTTRKDCCCKSDIHGFSFHCHGGSGVSVGLAWYEILTICIIVVGVVVAAIVIFVWYRRRRGYARQI